MTSDEFREIVTDYRTDIQAMIAEHRKYKGWDGTLYNAITGVVLLCTALLSVLPPTQSESQMFWFAKGIAVLSMFLVALDRALGFGPRWRFHIEMQNSYRTLLDELLALERTSPDDAGPPLIKFRASLASVRSREHLLPGISTTSASKQAKAK